MYKMKKSIKVTIFLIIFLILFFISWIYVNFINIDISHKLDEIKIKRLMRKENPEYDIEKIILEYTDWSSTVHEIDDKWPNNKRATDAKVYLKNNNGEVKYIRLSKNIFCIWKTWDLVPAIERK